MVIAIICCALFIGAPLAVTFGEAFGAASGKHIFKLREREFAAKQQVLDQTRSRLDLLLAETAQGNPAFATQIADLQYERDLALAHTLENKSHPALKAAEQIKIISSEKRALKQENRVLTYQLNFYETLFPWLTDFKEVSTADALAAVRDASDADYDTVRRWISPVEYQKLNSAQRNQLALERWKDKKKSSWEIGIAFERFVGYKLECEGYRVQYFGATMGLEDLGRDLIASKGKEHLVIQCKRWAKEKTIHEKHICQLYGSVAVLASQNPSETYKGVFITSTTLSDVAKLFANYSKIAVVENLQIEDYPLIKCNFAKGGDKIYHLPFDQQYDKINIQKNSRCLYVQTAGEAEKLGYRRAYSWHPNKD